MIKERVFPISQLLIERRELFGSALLPGRKATDILTLDVERLRHVATRALRRMGLAQHCTEQRWQLFLSRLGPPADRPEDKRPSARLAPRMSFHPPPPPFSSVQHSLLQVIHDPCARGICDCPSRRRCRPLSAKVKVSILQVRSETASRSTPHSLMSQCRLFPMYQASHCLRQNRAELRKVPEEGY